jgi:hypothetical protein
VLCYRTYTEHMNVRTDIYSKRNQLHLQFYLQKFTQRPGSNQNDAVDIHFLPRVDCYFTGAVYQGVYQHSSDTVGQARPCSSNGTLLLAIPWQQLQSRAKESAPILPMYEPCHIIDWKRFLVKCLAPGKHPKHLINFTSIY